MAAKHLIRMNPLNRFWKPASLAKDMAKLLKAEQQSLTRELLHLYQDTLRTCLEEDGRGRRLPATTVQTFDVTGFNPKFPMAHPVFHQLIEQITDKVTQETNSEESAHQLVDHVGLYREYV